LILPFAESPGRPIAKRGAIQQPAATAPVEVRKRRRVLVIGVIMAETVPKWPKFQ
jgi:hypothetical protein